MTYPKKEANDLRVQQVESAYEAYINSPKYVRIDKRDEIPLKGGMTLDESVVKIFEDGFYFEKLDDHKYRVNVYVLDISELAKAAPQFVEAVKDDLEIPLTWDFREKHFNMK